MEGKKSFVLYADVKTSLDLLTDEQAGKVFKYVVDYVNDLHPDKPADPLANLALAPIEAQLKRDLQKWRGIREKRSAAGKKSAAKRAEQAATIRTSVGGVKQKEVLPTVNVIDNVIDNETVIVNDNETLKLKDRKLKFAESLQPYLVKYGRENLNDFFNYWTEHNEQGKKMRYEYAKNQPFNVSRRLLTWVKKNEQNAIFKPGQTKKVGAGINADYMEELKTRIKGGK